MATAYHQHAQPGMAYQGLKAEALAKGALMGAGEKGDRAMSKAQKHWNQVKIQVTSSEWELVKLLEQLREMCALRAAPEKARPLIARAIDMIVPEANHTTRQLRCNFRDNHGCSLLMVVAQLGTAEQARTLREHGGHVSLRDTHSRNAFHYLGLRGPRDTEAAGVLHVLAGPAEEFMPLVSMLRDPVVLGEALNAPTHTGMRPLHIVAASGSAALAQIMPQYGADPNITDATGQTPIFKAVQNAHPPVVQALIEVDASIDHLDAHGRKAVDFAADRPDVQKVLHRAKTYGFGPFHPAESLTDYYPQLGVPLNPRRPRAADEILLRPTAA